MRITKLVCGIFLIVLAGWLIADGVVNGILGIWTGTNLVSGVLEIIMAGLFSASGIIYIIFEKSKTFNGDVTGLILLVISGTIGSVGGFFDSLLFLYAVISFIVGIGFFVWHCRVPNYSHSV
ncbi:hypothetical protein [uncultured Limosilactobacillus sp.]|uniref:hypothetical protein n=1 Tax=uncultured Limosilactobacillus sp. TaxID=2837629 RepID=UPI0025DECB53|nr:hypothetical protein [uncultured Limosilactobacillus sp.]